MSPAPTTDSLVSTSLRFGIGALAKLAVTIFLSTGLALTGVGWGILKWGDYILQSSLTDLRGSMKEAREAFVREINEKTDGGKLQTTVAVLNERLVGLSELPKKLDTLNESVRTLNADVKSFNDRLVVITKTLDDQRNDTKSILQKIADRPSGPDNALWLISFAPENQKSQWVKALKDLSMYGYRADMAPVFLESGKYAARVADERILPWVLKSGFIQVSDPKNQPPGIYVTLSQ